MRGAELTLEIPIFDFGEARLREAEQTYLRAVNVLAERAVVARSEAREGYLAYKGAWDVARLYQSQVPPLRKAIQDESLLQYNGMLADLFTLINDARARALSNVAAIDARRDFWIAEGRRPPMSVSSSRAQSPVIKERTGRMSNFQFPASKGLPQ